MFFDTADLHTDEIFLKLTETLPAVPEKRWVPVYCFKICRAVSGEEVGECNFRVGNTEKLFFGGNIGYTVDEPFRGNHYAAKACLLLFKLAKKHGMRHLHITCTPDNIASNKTCRAVGGVLECTIDLPTDNDMYLEGERQKRIYRIDL
ncbi:MAG: GNAT family N-acetyltransferase [Oscillospiraceae bacterium]|jgi:predicted acetyltransferase|nr:GNAT family N-acetyltransferase [Oscillospiraceae bacterium]